MTGASRQQWLRRLRFPGAERIDLLLADTALELGRHPERLRALVGERPRGTWVCIDEVQKVPALLDEVHGLIERRGLRFALTGSSAPT